MSIVTGKIVTVNFLEGQSRLTVQDINGESHQVFIDDDVRDSLSFHLCMNTLFMFEVKGMKVTEVVKA